MRKQKINVREAKASQLQRQNTLKKKIWNPPSVTGVTGGSDTCGRPS